MIPLTFNNTDVINAILDTGADVSVMSKQTFDKIPVDTKTPLEPSRLADNRVKGVTGHALKSLGISKISFSIGPTNWTLDFEVFDHLKNTALLGSDFLAQSKAQIDFEKRTLRLGEHIQLLQYKDRSTKLALVRVQEKVHISPSSTVTFPGRIGSKDRTMQGTVVITPLGNAHVLQDQLCLLMPNLLVEADATGRVLLEVTKCFGRSFTLKAGMTIAVAEQESSAEINFINGIPDLPADGTELHSVESQPDTNSEKRKLNDLQLPAVKLQHSDANQRACVGALLIENTDVFAQKELDPGKGTHRIRKQTQVTPSFFFFQ